MTIVPTSDPQRQTRRRVLRRAAYVAPTIVAIGLRPAVGLAASGQVPGDPTPPPSDPTPPPPDDPGNPPSDPPTLNGAGPGPVLGVRQPPVVASTLPSTGTGDGVDDATGSGAPAAAMLLGAAVLSGAAGMRLRAKEGDSVADEPAR